MNVLIVKNIAAEGPCTIEDYLRAENLPYSIVDLGKDEAVPDLDAFTHLVVLGGPMAVYEIHRYPYLINEVALIDKAIKASKRVLGVCLGAQMVAHVLGAKVYPGQRKEIGWCEVALTAEGMNDPAMSVLAMPGKNAAQVFQWHGDTFDLPREAVRMASSGLFSNQAFRYKDRVYALQFHIEVTPAIVHDWLKCEQGVELAALADESEKIFRGYRERAMMFYRRFFSYKKSI